MQACVETFLTSLLLVIIIESGSAVEVAISGLPAIHIPECAQAADEQDEDQSCSGRHFGLSRYYSAIGQLSLANPVDVVEVLLASEAQ